MLKRKNRRFSIMAAGYRGTGKSSFFNTLFNNNIVPLSPSTDINLFMLNVDCEGVSQKVSLVDTPGFGSGLNDSEVQNNIVNFIKLQFDTFIEEESKIRRDPYFEDPRIHCLLYFVPATTKGLRQNDIQFLKKIDHLVNIIPVISKSDGLCDNEKNEMKMIINNQILSNDIKIFDFEHQDYYEKIDKDQNLNNYIPFSVVSSDNENVVSRVRKFKWGTVEIDNADHCDFVILKEILLGTHLNILIDFTGSELYETYRATVLENKIFP
jgi:cell division control protein 11